MLLNWEPRVANEPESTNLPVTIHTLGVDRAGTRPVSADTKTCLTPINTRGADAVFDDALEDTFSPR
jgi:hypothetical protein